MSRFVTLFLTRHGCHLCEEARPLVEREVEKAGGTVEMVDVDRDHVLLDLYGSRIPVLLGPDREVLAEGIITGEALRRSLREVR